MSSVHKTRAPSTPPRSHDPAPREPHLVDLVDEQTRTIIHRRRFGRMHRRGWLVRRALAAADVAGLVASFALAQLLVGPGDSTVDRVDARLEVVAFVVTLPLWIILARLSGLYSRDEERADHSTVDDARGVLAMVTVGAFLLIAISWLTGRADPYMPKLLTFWLTAIVLVTLLRALARAFVRRSPAYLQNTVIVGAGDIAQLIASKLLRHPEYGINLLGFVDKVPATRRDDIGDLAILGDVEELSRVVQELDVERVIVAFALQKQRQLVTDLRRLRTRDVQIDLVPRFFDMVGPGASFHAIEGMPVIGLAPTHLPHSSLFLKRALDLVASLAGLVLLSPLYAYIALRVKLDSPGPVFYRHERVGLHGKPIEVVKFRTMRKEFSRGARYGGEEAERKFAELMADEDKASQFEASYKLQDDPRVTPYGAFLRRTSLDELPQLWNVLKGDLSVVGPRPIVADEVSRYGPGGEELFNVKPGITGYWQVNGRSDLDYADRVRLDLSYVGDWSMGLDLTIMGKTVRSVLKGSGAR